MGAGGEGGETCTAQAARGSRKCRRDPTPIRRPQNPRPDNVSFYWLPGSARTTYEASLADVYVVGKSLSSHIPAGNTFCAQPRKWMAAGRASLTHAQLFSIYKALRHHSSFIRKLELPWPQLLWIKESGNGRNRLRQPSRSQLGMVSSCQQLSVRG